MDKEQLEEQHRVAALTTELQRILNEEAYAGTVETITTRVKYLFEKEVEGNE